MDKFGEKLGVQKSAISKIEKDKVKLIRPDGQADLSRIQCEL
mgnify:FL=1